MSLQGVFFDLDGTLLDTAQDMGHALNRLLESEGKETLAMERIRYDVSNGSFALIKMAFNIDSKHPEFEPLRQKFLAFYLENPSTYTTPFDGIYHLIEKLAGNNIAWGIVTNKPWAYTEPLLEQYSFASKPQTVVCPDHVQEKKPAPDALLLACNQTNCHVDRAIYVGDHARDIECGKRAKMKTIAVGYGYIAPDDSHLNWDATHCVETANELWPIIKSYI